MLCFHNTFIFVYAFLKKDHVELPRLLILNTHDRRLRSCLIDLHIVKVAHDQENRSLGEIIYENRQIMLLMRTFKDVGTLALKPVHSNILL